MAPALEQVVPFVVQVVVGRMPWGRMFGMGRALVKVGSGRRYRRSVKPTLLVLINLLADVIVFALLFGLILAKWAAWIELAKAKHRHDAGQEKVKS